MRNVYIDLGANIGDTVRQFLTENPSYECYAFEPNMALLPRLAEAGLQLPQPHYLIWAAAWVFDGTIDLFQSGSPAASTIVSGKVEFTERGWPPIDYSRPVRVPSVDFSQWLARRFSPGDNITVKMDIEGAEYAVLEKMLADGTLSMLKMLRCEWHQDRFPDISLASHNMLRERVAASVPVEDWT
jgi:FkbM family methyltransferase